MNTRHCQKIAVRIDTLLRQEIGHDIDITRMLTEPRYARDVLLVCDALRGTAGADLAGHFRRAALAAEETAAAPRKGFSASRFLSSLLGANSGFGQQPAVPPRPADTAAEHNAG